MEQTVVDPCGCVLISDGIVVRIFSCVQSMAKDCTGVIVVDGAILVGVAI